MPNATIQLEDVLSRGARRLPNRLHFFQQPASSQLAVFRCSPEQQF